MRARRRKPRGARAAGRIVRLLGCGGCITLLLVCLIIAFASLGSRYVSTATGNTDCQVPQQHGGPGLEIFGDSALTGLAQRMPKRLAGGAVVEDVKAGRTAQQGENVLDSMPATAPGTFVISLEEDDASDPVAYTDRIDELLLLLSGRTVYWVTAPGKNADTAIVQKQNDTPDPGQSDQQDGWHLVDFAAAVAKHADWWRHDKPGAAGLTQLAKALAEQIGTPTATGGGASAITVTSTINAHHSFTLTAERRANASVIVAVGAGLGVPARGQVIAVATAIQESELVNLPGGPDDSIGLFQQRPSQGWGSPAQLHDARYAATVFYQHLLRVSDWQNMSLTDAAQAVQRSAYPDAYAQWEQAATVIVAALTGQHAPGCGPQVNTGNAQAQIAVNAALSQLGVPYSYAGGNPNGPTLGQCVPGTGGWNDCHIVGFDCSGLMLYAWAKAGVTVPHNTVAMWNDPAFIHITDKAQLQAGDMLMFDGNPPGHTGMYLGHGQLVDAPHSGSVVKIESLDNDPWYRDTYLGALRPKA
jgi:Cell wall-associated hydrolases (invasion-associated proteins)